MQRPERVHAEFGREGEFWRLNFAGVVAFTPHVHGLTYLAYLLAHPGSDVSAVDLLALGGSRRAQPSAADEHLAYDVGGDCGEVLDRRARRAYTRRLAEIQRILPQSAETEPSNQTAALHREFEFLTAELQRAHGPGGRARTLGAHRDRVRSNVSRALRTAVHRINVHHAPLGAHLDGALNTGSMCRYVPRAPWPIWRF